MNLRVKVLTSERISLVVPEKQDLDLWYKGVNDIEISSYILTTFGKVIYRENQDEYYDKIRKDETNITYSIFINNDEKIIGNISLYEISYRDRNCMLGIAIFAKDEQNKGYGTESIKLILKYAFDVLGLNKVKLGYLSINEKVKKIYEKIGFKEVGRLKNDIYIMGKYYDDIYMEIFKEEFVF